MKDYIFWKEQKARTYHLERCRKKTVGILKTIILLAVVKLPVKDSLLYNQRLHGYGFENIIKYTKRDLLLST